MSKVKISRLALIQNYVATGIGYVTIDYIGQKFFTSNEVLKKENYEKEAFLNAQKQIGFHSLVRNFVYGFIFANFNQVFHLKLNNFLQKNGYKSTMKLVFSPFAFLPYYFFSGTYDKKPLSEIQSQIISDALTLILIRVPIDFVRTKFYFQNNAAVQQGPPVKKILFFHLGSKSIVAFTIVNMYSGRIQGLKNIY